MKYWSVVTGALEHAAWTHGQSHLSAWRSDLSWLQMHSVDVIFAAIAVVGTALALLFGVLWLVVKAMIGMTWQRRRALVADKKAH